jgi:hypothetical protein
MSSSYFITPYDPKAWEDPDDDREKPSSDLKIYREQFRSALLEHWGPKRIREDKNTAINSWLLTNPQDAEDVDLEIRLQENYQVIECGNFPKHAILEFVLWYRRFIPATYPLYFFHSSAWDSLVLTTDTTEQAIIDFTGIVS